MGHIKEPQGVDFIIESKPLTDDDRAAISEYIRNYKAKQKGKQSSRRTTTRTKSKKAST
jgi:hypothetical protein